MISAIATTSTVASRWRRKVRPAVLRKLLRGGVAPGGSLGLSVRFSPVSLTLLIRSLRLCYAIPVGAKGPGTVLPGLINSLTPAARRARAPGRPLPAAAERGPPGTGVRSGAGGGLRVLDGSGRALDVLLRRGLPLEPAGHLVVAQAGLLDEGQAGVGVGRDDRAAGQVVQVHVHNRQEALQVRVLVDDEVGQARLDVRQRGTGRVEPAVRDGQAGRLQLGAEELGRAPVHRERALEGLVTQQVRLDRGLLLTGQRAGGHLVEGVAALGLEHRGRTVVAGLDVAGARGGDEDGDVAATRHEGDDLLPHLLAGDVQRLPDVGQPVRADLGLAVGERAVRVVGEHRNTRVHGIHDRRLERIRVDNRHGNSVGFRGDRRADVSGHLRDGGGLRTAPLRGGQTEQGGRVGHTVLRRREELVRGDVINEPVLPLRRAREIARDLLGRARVAVRGRGAGRDQRRRCRGCAEQSRALEQLPPSGPVLHIEALYGLVDYWV